MNLCPDYCSLGPTSITPALDTTVAILLQDPLLRTRPFLGRTEWAQYQIILSVEAITTHPRKLPATDHRHLARAMAGETLTALVMQDRLPLEFMLECLTVVIPYLDAPSIVEDPNHHIVDTLIQHLRNAQFPGEDRQILRLHTLDRLRSRGPTNSDAQ